MTAEGQLATQELPALTPAQRPLLPGLRFRTLPAVLDVWEFIVDPSTAADWMASASDLHGSGRQHAEDGSAVLLLRVVEVEPNRRARVELTSSHTVRWVTLTLTPGGSKGTLVEVVGDGFPPAERGEAEHAQRVAAQVLARRFAVLVP